VANHKAIATVSKAISRLIERSCEGGDFIGAKCDLVHADRYSAPVATNFTGYYLLLYRVDTSTCRRPAARRSEADGRNRRPALPLDLHYLLTAAAADAESQQRLLGLAMRAIEDMPILPAGFLNDCTPERDVFRADETVEIVPDPLALTDLLAVWDKLQAGYMTSATYVARMVDLDSTLELREAGLVQTRVFSSGAGAAP
jgi:hypothetical protein